MVVKMSDNKTTPTANAVASVEATANDRFARAKQARDAAIAKRDANRKTGTPRERDNDLGGQALKLSVIGEIAGYHMYWANDENAEIEELIYQGFDFVEPGEVRRAADLVVDMDLSNRISRYVGTRTDGSPLRAYLMKCTTEIWEARQARRMVQVDEWDNQIRNGRMKPQDNTQYVPTGFVNKLQTGGHTS